MYIIQVNIIYFKYIISLYIRKYITSSPQALNLIEYILNFSKCSILIKNIKSKQKFGLLTTKSWRKVSLIVLWYNFTIFLKRK